MMNGTAEMFLAAYFRTSRRNGHWQGARNGHWQGAGQSLAVELQSPKPVKLKLRSSMQRWGNSTMIRILVKHE
ncbi:hypothetical protein SAMN04487769_1355 [Burkholderia sp. b14]|nr:hypothetical protein SAMN04487769_1355 [Burkholderia sp. b14]